MDGLLDGWGGGVWQLWGVMMMMGWWGLKVGFGNIGFVGWEWVFMIEGA